MHTDAVIEHLELFHDSVAAALEWSTGDPAVGLRMLRLLSRAWHAGGRPQAALAAVDRLLTDENAERFPLLWAAAAASVAVLVGTARSRLEADELVQRGRDLADAAGDDYLVAVNEMLIGYTADNCERVRRLAHERGQRYVECVATMAQASVLLEADPRAAWAMLDDADFQAAARESRYLRDWADRTTSRAALYLGDLEGCIEITRRLCASRSLLMAESAVLLLGAAALLASDESAADAGASVAQERHSKVPGTQTSAEFTVHQRSLLAGGPARVDAGIRPENVDLRDRPAAFIVMLLCREAVEAGEAHWLSRRSGAGSARCPLGGQCGPRSRRRPRRTRTDGMRHCTSPSSTSFALIGRRRNRRARWCRGDGRVLGRVPPARGRGFPFAR